MLAVCSAPSAQGAVASFLVTNNDVPLPNPPMPYPGNTLSFYTINADGSLSGELVVDTNGDGVGGGSFGYARIAILPQARDVCVFASNAGSNTIASISATSHAVIDNFVASALDSGIANGIGLTANSHFLYAKFSSSSTIATFAVQAGCQLQFLGDVLAVGLDGGLVSGSAITGSTLVVTYGDGSLESFNISGGIPVSNGDAMQSSGSADDHVPSGVVITADGHYALFGDGSTVANIEVSDISSGTLTPTVAYSVGNGWNSESVALSPDETVVFATNNSGGEVTAAFFNKVTGVITPGCTSKPLRGFYNTWSYAGGAALQLSTGTGGLIYVPEFGSNGFSSIGIVQFASTGTRCTLTETANSPVLDNTNASILLSIGTYVAPTPHKN